MITTILLTCLGFLLGSIPFSVVVGHMMLGVDIRTVGDGNPGATNVLRAGGGVGGFLLAGLLDYLKAAALPAIAWFGLKIDDLALIPIALAGVYGHAFSPFLNWQGGKAIAATFGMWSGLTLAEIPTILGLMLALWFIVLTVDGWAVIFAFLPLSIYLWWLHPPAFLGIWVGNFMLLLYKHRKELSQPLRLKPINLFPNTQS